MSLLPALLIKNQVLFLSNPPHLLSVSPPTMVDTIAMLCMPTNHQIDVYCESRGSFLEVNYQVPEAIS